MWVSFDNKTFDTKEECEAYEKQALESTLESKIATVVHEKDEKILFLQHHLEAAILEKQQFQEPCPKQMTIHCWWQIFLVFRQFVNLTSFMLEVV